MRRTLILYLGLILFIPQTAYAQQKDPFALLKKAHTGIQRFVRTGRFKKPVERAVVSQRLEDAGLGLASSASSARQEPFPSMHVSPIQESFINGPRGPVAGSSWVLPGANLMPGSTFRAHSTGLHSVAYSGTIFKDGDDIFGLVATHTVRRGKNNSLALFDSFEAMNRQIHLGKTFQLEIYDENGLGIPLSGEIVQVGAMVDISLVKFNPADESKLSPLLLRSEEISADTPLQLQGFTHYPWLMSLDNLSVFRSAPTFMQFHVPGNKEERIGLCGSLIRDKHNKLAGVFIGHQYGKTADELDIGYMAPVSSIKALVNAYRKGGEGTLQLTLNREDIIPISLDEWINQIDLYDKQGNFLWSSGTIKQFSYRKIEAAIKQFSPASMELSIGKIGWNSNGELRTIDHKQVTYDFSLKQVTDIVHD